MEEAVRVLALPPMKKLLRVARVPLAERKREASEPKPMPPVEMVEEAKDRRCKGVEVPIPTLPPYGWRKRLPVLRAEPMVKLPEADAIGPPKVVVAVPVIANDDVVPLVKSKVGMVTSPLMVLAVKMDEEAAVRI